FEVRLDPRAAARVAAGDGERDGKHGIRVAYTEELFERKQLRREMKLIPIIAIMAVSSMAAEQTVYIGTRTSTGRSQGVYRMTFDPATGALSEVKLAAATVDPSFIALHATRPLLFAVVASPEGKVKSFHVEPDGNL